MATRSDRTAGANQAGEMNGKRFAEYIGVAHGTVKRWLHEGLPARRSGRGVWITPSVAEGWIRERFPRKTIAFERAAFVYLARRQDGLVKIGWSSDVMRRVAELRKMTRQAVELLACFPGDKPAELALHERFAALAEGGEWFRDGQALRDYIDGLSRAA